MTKQEISEIKKLLTPRNCSITRICGCYVDGEKNKKTQLKQAFLALPEEEMFKYFEILRKVLSGTLGKNLLNLEFPLASELILSGAGSSGDMPKDMAHPEAASAQDDAQAPEELTACQRIQPLRRALRPFCCGCGTAGSRTNSCWRNIMTES